MCRITPKSNWDHWKAVNPNVFGPITQQLVGNTKHVADVVEIQSWIGYTYNTEINNKWEGRDSLKPWVITGDQQGYHPPPLTLFQLMDERILCYPMDHWDGSLNKKEHCSLFARPRAHSLRRVLFCMNIWDLASLLGDRDLYGIMGTRVRQMLTRPLMIMTVWITKQRKWWRESAKYLKAGEANETENQPHWKAF